MSWFYCFWVLDRDGDLPDTSVLKVPSLRCQSLYLIIYVRGVLLADPSDETETCDEGRKVRFVGASKTTPRLPDVKP